MNSLLQLKGRFQHIDNPNKGFGSPGLGNDSYQIEHLRDLLQQLEKIDDRWSSKEKIFESKSALLSVEYNRVIPKSKRISGFLSEGNKSSNNSIVGARYGVSQDNTKIWHIITHFVSLDILKKSVDDLRGIISKLENVPMIDQNLIEKINEKDKDIVFDVPKTTAIKYLVDASSIERFFVSDEVDLEDNNSIITLYNTNIDTTTLLGKLGIVTSKANILDNDTVYLSESDVRLLKTQAPYLISMEVEDLTKLADDSCLSKDITKNTIQIPKPKNEPIIGVIDTLFDDRVYFSEWVEYRNMLDEDIPTTPKDFEHGTAVSSIIVDGASINPNIDDKCGRFRVRHFGVATSGKFSSFSVLKSIEAIMLKNQDIKVWNLSLGSDKEINPNSISPEGYILDKLQHKYDVIFIVSGTNDNQNTMKKRIGSPADSINSIVVNSVDHKNKPASYTRMGPVLSFYRKPDIAYFGGDTTKAITVCEPLGQSQRLGTSFAAPWIARKMAYLIHILGFNKEVAKALIIDSAIGWEKSILDYKCVGFGVVPTRIDDIINCKNDEIRFVMSGKAQKYTTYNYRLPVPVSKDKHPYIAKATLCYFPSCLRSCGVDYTSTEFSFKFGVLTNKDGKDSIKSINDDKQDEDGHMYLEKTARKWYRKWDNIKHIKEHCSSRKLPKTMHSTRMWGISITTKERDDERHGDNMPFGVVVTLKALDNKNRINEFIRNCDLSGWLVERIDIENKIELFNKIEEEVEFE